MTLCPMTTSPRRLSELLAVDPALRGLGIPMTLHLNVRGCLTNLTEVRGREIKRPRPNIFLYPRKLRRPWDGHDPGLLREQPCEGNLRGSRVLSLRDRREQIHQRAIRLPGFRR